MKITVFCVLVSILVYAEEAPLKLLGPPTDLRHLTPKPQVEWTIPLPPPATQATARIDSPATTGTYARWQDVPAVPKNIEKSAALRESSDNPNVGIHSDGTSVGWFGITPGFVQMLIDKKWIPKQRYDLNNGWQNRWLFRRGLQYFYRDCNDWSRALALYHGSSDVARNEKYAKEVIDKAKELEATSAI